MKWSHVQNPFTASCNLYETFRSNKCPDCRENIVSTKRAYLNLNDFAKEKKKIIRLVKLNELKLKTIKKPRRTK